MEQAELENDTVGRKNAIPKNMLGRFYIRIMSLSKHRHAMKALAAVSFVESSVFPIPPDAMMIPMVLAKPRNAFWIATVCTVTSVLGGLLGYFIGYGLWETVGKPLVEMYGYDENISEFTIRYNDWGAWIVFTAGITPFPYKVITIASGLTRLDLTIFICASILSRGLRFFVVAALLYRFGEPIRTFIEGNLGKFALLFVLSLFAGFVLIKWLM